MDESFLTEDERNIKEYLHRLRYPEQEDLIPHFLHLLEYEDMLYLKIAQEMYYARTSGGVRGLKACVNSLRRRNDPRCERLLQVLLDNDSLDLEGFAGILFSEAEAQPYPWIWTDFLALGKIGTFDGDPALGKSTVLGSVSSAITTGKNMPDGTPCLARGGVVMISPEDNLEDTVLPRFARAGADLSKVVDLTLVPDDDCSESMRPFQLETDLDYLDAAIRHVNAKLVCIDPLMAVLNKDANTNSDEAVRALLSPLKDLIEYHRVGCILVRHMTKTRGSNPLMAGIGSIGFIGLARTGWSVEQNPKDKTQFLLTNIKNNHGLRGTVIPYTIRSDRDLGDDRPYVVWGKAIHPNVTGD
jgi:hypothetical protein